MKIMTCQLTSGAASSLGRRILAWLTAVFLLASAMAQAAPLADLTGGQTGRIEFQSSTPDHRFAMVRNRLGPSLTIFGDLLMPPQPAGGGKVPAVVFSHGSDGITSLYYDLWAKELNAAGYAVFVVDSFKPRGVDNATGPEKQLVWNVTGNIADALYALRLLVTHPQIDAQRIYHMGWSRGGTAALDAAWPTYQQYIVPASVKWAGTVALYPGCTTLFRTDRHEKLQSPLMMLVGEKDDMTPAQPCVDYAKELSGAGNPVTVKVYPGAYHVFDRLNQPWRKFNEGNFAKCKIMMWMPKGVSDPYFGGDDLATGKSIRVAQDLLDAYKACQQVSWITVESNPKAREQAVRDVMEFLGKAR